MRIHFLALAAVLLATVLPAPPAAAQRGGQAQVSAEMRDFMKRLDGTEKGVNAALKMYAAEGVDTAPMHGIQVRDAKVTKVEAKEGMTCYTMECKTGILDRTYSACWKDKKIQQFKQLSVK